MANACISLISSRTECLPLCLKSIHDHFNKNHNYPIYVHYFDDIYDDFKVDVPNVEFIQVPYKSPIPESEMFYNRDNRYAKRCFPIGRKGYLHMCNFVVNMYKYPNTKIHNHDYVIVFDDESGFVKDVDFDPIERMGHNDMSAMITGQRLTDGKPPQNHIDTREGLYDFFMGFCNKHNKYELDFITEDLFHKLDWSDGYIVKTKMYENQLWKTWVAAVNLSAGIYKHRWGDNEVMSLWNLVHEGAPILNLGLVKFGYLKQDLFRKIQNMAPGVKDNTR